jgi:hypothetical protein
MSAAIRPAAAHIKEYCREKVGKKREKSEK